ncbi:LptF/LptG family permease [Bacteroidota bacterium]
MKKVDLYIIKKFLGTFFYAISLIILIVVVFDISEKIDDFIEKQAPLKEIFLVYYLNFIPNFVNLFSPLFTFIAVIYFTSRMAANTEIVAILSSGISFRRMLLPYLISSFILAIMSFYLANFVIPHANEVRRTFKNMYIESTVGSYDRNIHIQISPKKYVFLESYNKTTQIGHRFSYEIFNKKNELIYKINSQFIKWDSISNRWIAEDYFIRNIDGMDENIKRGKKLFIKFKLKPEDFIISKENWETMSYRQIREYINVLKLKGSNELKFYEVEKHKRVSFPCATIVLTLIGVSLSSRKMRGGTGMHLGLGILISFTFILFMQISTVFATMGNLSPLIAVWIPNIIFTILGIFLLRIAPK